MTPPTAEGGALRSQDARTTGDPTGLDGALLRVDPDTGDPLPDNPGTGDLNARRIVAYGFRNPFRFAFRPGTTDAYVGDVGWLPWEEIDRVPDTTSQVRNYGWPCYEGSGRQSGYEALGLNLCRNLYTAGTARPAAVHVQPRRERRRRGLPGGTSSISGVTFYEGETFPPAYRGAMFFADYTRNCIWVMFPDADGMPNPATRQVFAEARARPWTSRSGPAATSTTPTSAGGTIQRIRAVNPNQAPTAAFTATPDHGAAPLHVDFDATGSTDPNGDALLYAWDLDGDGAYDDSSSATPSARTRTRAMVTVRLRVTDPVRLGRHRDDRDDGRHPADGHDQRRRPTADLRRRRPRRLRRLARGARTARRPDERARVDGRPQPLLGARAHELPRPPHDQNYVGVRVGLLRLSRPRVPVVRHADPDRDRGLRPARHGVGARSTRRRSS